MLIILSLLGIACVGQKGVTNVDSDSAEQDTRKLQLVLEDNYSGIEQSEFQVVRDSKTLKNFFLQINKTRKPGLPIPEVDFTEEVLLVYCAGTTMGAWGAELFVIEDSQNNIVIGPKERTPTKKEVTNITTTPFSIYKLPLTLKEISFQ